VCVLCYWCRGKDLTQVLAAMLRQQCTPANVKEFMRGRGMPTHGTDDSRYNRLARLLVEQYCRVSEAQPPPSAVQQPGGV
jgi:hypothetical protein